MFSSCCIFSDRSGIFRTFEANENAESSGPQPTRRGRAQMQLTDEQLQRLQAQKPAITEAVMDGVEFAVDQGRGLQWLCLLSASGRLEVSHGLRSLLSSLTRSSSPPPPQQIRSLPALDVVFRATGLLDSVADLVDQGDDKDEEMGEDVDEIDGLTVADVGTRSARPHLIVSRVDGAGLCENRHADRPTPRPHTPAGG